MILNIEMTIVGRMIVSPQDAKRKWTLKWPFIFRIKFLFLERNPTNSLYIFILSVNFENLTVRLYVLIISLMFTKFQENQKSIAM